MSAFAQAPLPLANEWTFDASVLGYAVPDDSSYVSPNLIADKGKLHVEARYNYESLQTGSLWIGRNFNVGNKLKLEITPMVGGVFGKTNGIAPGYSAALMFGRFYLDSQAEYLFATDSADRFLYNWSEFSYSPLHWFRAGLVAQHTKAYKTQLDIQRGVLAGFSYKRWEFTTYVFNIGWGDVTSVFALGVQF